MKKILVIILTMILGLSLSSFSYQEKANEIVDVLTSDSLNLGGNYGEYYSEQHPSGAIYKSIAMRPKHGAIQLTDEHDAGIVVDYAPLNYIPTKISISWDTGRTSPDRSLDVYAKNERYLSVSELHKASTQGEWIITTDKTLNNDDNIIEGGYQYIGIRAYRAAIYLKSISITWTKVSSLESNSITFKLNNGSKDIVINNLTNSNLIFMPNMLKPFNSFGGFYTDSIFSNEFAIDSKITSDLVLYAKWNELPITDCNLLPDLADGSDVVVSGKFTKLDFDRFITDSTGTVKIYDRYLIQNLIEGNYYTIHGKWSSEHQDISNLVGIKESEYINPIQSFLPKTSLKMRYMTKSNEVLGLDLRFGGILGSNIYNEESRYFVVASNSSFNVTSEKDLNKLTKDGKALELKGPELSFVIENVQLNASYYVAIYELDHDMLYSTKIVKISVSEVLDKTIAELENNNYDANIINMLKTLKK